MGPGQPREVSLLQPGGPKSRLGPRLLEMDSGLHREGGVTRYNPGHCIHC